MIKSEMTTLEVCSLIVSASAALIAIAALVQTVTWRQQTKKETEKLLHFMTHLKPDSAAEPDTVRRIPEDFRKIGDHRDNAVTGSDAQYRLRHDTRGKVVTGSINHTSLSNQQPLPVFSTCIKDARDGDRGCGDIEHLVGLVHKGDTSSLSQVRRELGKTIEEISMLVGVPAGTLDAWEGGKENPLNGNMIAWRLKMGDLVDEKIAGYIGTENTQLVTQFWEIMWRLNDLDLKRGKSTRTM